MIERKFVAQKFKEFQIQELITQNLKRVGHSHTKMIKTPAGEKIIIYTSRPGLIVGRKGQNIKRLTKTLKNRFNLENPQIEISEVTDVMLDAQIVAERIANSLERFGTSKFKGIGHKVLGDVMDAGALGIEVCISGKIPSSRAKRWRFYQGYLKKSGDIAVAGVRKAYATAELKTGTVGIQVRIMPQDLILPDYVELSPEKIIEMHAMKDKAKKKTEASAEADSESGEGKKTEKKKRAPARKKKKTEEKTEAKKPMPEAEEQSEEVE